MQKNTLNYLKLNAVSLTIPMSDECSYSFDNIAARYRYVRTHIGTKSTYVLQVLVFIHGHYCFLFAVRNGMFPRCSWSCFCSSIKGTILQAHTLDPV